MQMYTVYTIDRNLYKCLTDGHFQQLKLLIYLFFFFANTDSCEMNHQYLSMKKAYYLDHTMPYIGKSNAMKSEFRSKEGQMQ